MRILLNLIFCFLVSTQISSQTVIWDESIDGDLAADDNIMASPNTVFQQVNLVEGVNLIRGSVGNTIFNGTAGANDAFSFTVPQGCSVSAFEVSSFTLQNSNNLSFFLLGREHP